MTLRVVAAACVPALACLLSAGAASGAISYIGEEKTGAGQFSDPQSLAVNAAGELVVADSGNGRIQTLNTDGDHLLSFDSGVTPFTGWPRRSLTIGAGDTIFQTGDSNAIHRFTKDGASLGQWSPANHLIRELASDGDGNLYVASFASAGGTIIKFTPDGVQLSEWPVIDGLGRPRQVSAIDARGNALVVVTTFTETLPAEVIRYSTTGVVLSRWELLPSSPWAVQGVAIADDGDLFMVGGQFVAQFSASGAFRSFYYGGTVYNEPDYANGPTSCEPTAAWYLPVRRHETVSYLGLVDVAVDAPGNVYALDATYSRIVKFDGRPTASLIWGPRRHWSGELPVTGQTITFDAGASELLLGSLTKFEWDLDGDGTFETDTGSTPRTARSYATAGARQVKVRVTGSRGLAAVAEETLEIAESQAIFVATRSTVPGEEVWFSAASSNLPCGTVLKYEWDLDGDGGYERDTGTNSTAIATYREVGGYEVGLRVTRAGGRIDEGRRWLKVRPLPPPGPVGVKINNGAEFTNSDRVTLQETWPKHASKVIVSNDAGFSRSRTFPVRISQPWVLDSSGSEHLPKTIYVRFTGANYLNRETLTDDINLDEIDPVVRRAARRRGGRLLVKARDSLSGLASMQVTRRRGRPGKWLPMRRISRVTDADVLWVRVRDRAGNRSRWKLAR